MLGAWILALRYLSYYRLQTCILVAALAITLALPLATRWLVHNFESEATARAAASPIVIGPKGSQFGLVMHALYFRGEQSETLPFEEAAKVEKTSGVKAIPLHAHFKAQGITVVGSNAEYLRLRQLQLAAGDTMERLGDCLLGSSAARRLGLAPGDSVVTDPESMFDLAGPSPLRMRVRGILRDTGTADDDVIHCHMETCWIIAGLGHGHEIEPTSPTDASPSQRDTAGGSPSEHQHAASRENLAQYAEITDENIRSFHFHGSMRQYPLTAIIAVPESEKAGTLLLGKYLEPDEKYQAIQPVLVVEEMVRMVAQVRLLFELLALVLSVGTAMLFGLVLWLSLKLRRHELATLQLLGASRWTIVAVVGLEMAVVCMLSLCLALLIAALIAYSSGWLVYWLGTVNK